MYITLIRHLPTEWNKKQKLQGRQDIDIGIPTEEFLKEIQSNQKLLEKIAPFDRVFAKYIETYPPNGKFVWIRARIRSLIRRTGFRPI